MSRAIRADPEGMPKTFRKISILSVVALLMTACSLAFTSFSATSAASAATVHKVSHKASHKTAHDVQGLPAEGIFDECSLDTQLNTCEQRLQTIQHGGFQVVVMGVPTSLDNLSSYASYAQSIGMKVMWAFGDPGFWTSPNGTSEDAFYSGISAACGCTANAQILNYMVHTLASLPATYGYYAADDSMIQPGQGGELKSYTQAIKSVDPNHTVIISASPGQGQSNEADADMLANEIYPVTTDQLDPQNQHLADWQSVDQSAAQAQQAADNAGKSSAFILQAFTFGDNLDDGEAVGACAASMSAQQCAGRLNYPDAATQLQLRNEVLEHANPKLVLWYNFAETYGQAGNASSSTTDPTASIASSRWAGLTNAVKAPAPGPVAQVAKASGKKSTHSKGAKANGSHIVVAG